MYAPYCIFMTQKREKIGFQNTIDEINNNCIKAKYRLMAFRLARWRCSWEFFGNFLGNPGQTKVMQMYWTLTAQYEC